MSEFLWRLFALVKHWDSAAAEQIGDLRSFFWATCDYWPLLGGDSPLLLAGNLVKSLATHFILLFVWDHKGTIIDFFDLILAQNFNWVHIFCKINELSRILRIDRWDILELWIEVFLLYSSGISRPHNLFDLDFAALWSDSFLTSLRLQDVLLRHMLVGVCHRWEFVPDARWNIVIVLAVYDHWFLFLDLVVGGHLVAGKF